MKQIYVLVFLSILITSCSSVPSGHPVLTAIAQTQIAQPTNTFVFVLPGKQTPLPPTPIPFADLDLEAILIQPGDLLLGIIGGQIQNGLPVMFDDIPQPVNQIYQQFSNINKENGAVAVLVYDTSTVANDVYNTIEENWGDQSSVVPVIGDKSNINFYIEEGLTCLDLLFMRCNTVGFIRLRNLSDSDYIISYAQSLDERLTPLVCP